MLKLKDKRFGKLIVIDYAYTKNKKTYWLCKCDCNSSPKIILGSKLTYGGVKSCGCLRHSKHYDLPYQWIYSILLRWVKESRYHDFIKDVMSYEDFLTFTKIDECHYCGEKIVWSEHTTYIGQYYNSDRKRKRNVNRKYNLDRKDNSKGYTKDNCVVCCTQCNFIKGKSLTYDEMCLLREPLHKIRELRKLKLYSEMAAGGNCLESVLSS